MTACITGWTAVADPGLLLDTVGARYARDADTPARLFHGRGRCYPGLEDLTVDLFPPYAVVGVHGGCPEQALTLAQALRQVLPGVAGLAVQLRDGRDTRWQPVWGELPDQHVVTEAGLRFQVRLGRNQNVGLFLDMAPLRRWLRAESRGVRVLNLFAYTCALSVAALAGGAELVVNNDMSRAALEWGRDNHALNDQDPRSVRMVPHNLFRSWWKLRQFAPYDLLVVDPPTRQRGSFDAARDYGQVLKRIPELMRPGGRVIACLNSPFLPRGFLLEQMAKWAPPCRLEQWLPASPDFPDREPERGLKVGLFEFPAGG